MTWRTHSHTDGFLAEFCTLHPGTAANSAVVLDTAVSQQGSVLDAPMCCEERPSSSTLNSGCEMWDPQSSPSQDDGTSHADTGMILCGCCNRAIASE